MTRRPFVSSLAASLATAALLTAPVNQAHAGQHISNAGAAILGGIAGVAVGAAIANSNQRHNNAYQQPGYQPYPYARPYPSYYPQPVYRPSYARPFSPAGGVVCYPDRELCFNNNGSVANKWTNRVYGY